MYALIRLLRLPLALIPPGAVVPILMGPLRGARWVVGSGNHAAWLGVYEFRKQVVFSKVVFPGSTVYDVGAHAGFYSLLASRLVGPRGKVIAFEPAPANLRYLRAHLELNRVTNVQVIEAAVSDRTGVGAFAEGASTRVHSSYLGRLVAHGGRQVPTVSLDDMVSVGQLAPPDYVKMDIEGGEIDALNGARLTLERFHPTIFLATHSRSLHSQCLELLFSLGYSVRPLLSRQDILETDELIAAIQPKRG